jgi:hypothetical protein
MFKKDFMGRSGTIISIKNNFLIKSYQNAQKKEIDRGSGLSKYGKGSCGGTLCCFAC